MANELRGSPTVVRVPEERDDETLEPRGQPPEPVVSETNVDDILAAAGRTQAAATGPPEETTGVSPDATSDAIQSSAHADSPPRTTRKRRDGHRFHGADRIGTVTRVRSESDPADEFESLTLSGSPEKIRMSGTDSSEFSDRDGRGRESTSANLTKTATRSSGSLQRELPSDGSSLVSDPSDGSTTFREPNTSGGIDLTDETDSATLDATGDEDRGEEDETTAHNGPVDETNSDTEPGEDGREANEVAREADGSTTVGDEPATEGEEPPHEADDAATEDDESNLVTSMYRLFMP